MHLQDYIILVTESRGIKSIYSYMNKNNLFYLGKWN